MTKANYYAVEVNCWELAKQDLGMANCHSITENHHHAHLQLLFATDTLLGYAHWQLNKEKTSDESCTHGEMVRCLFHTRCQIRSKNHYLPATA